MNESLRAQLTSSRWHIPRYARGALWVESVTGEVVRVDGEHGLFELKDATQAVIVRWGSPTGPAIARLPWRPDTLDWEGRVWMAGYLDAMHLTEMPGADAQAVLFLGGKPLRLDSLPYPRATQRQRTPYTAPGFHSGLVNEVPECVTTWLVALGSPLVPAVQDALNNNLRLHCFGSVATEASGWGDHFALPIVLHAITLFRP